MIDPDALALWASIKSQVEHGYRAVLQGRPVPEHGKRYELASVMAKLRSWLAHVNGNGATMAAQVDLYARCLTWVEDIREHLEPTKRVPLRGHACPACGLKSHKPKGGDRVPSITVVYCQPVPVALCQACGATWTGGEILELGNNQVAESQQA